MFILGSPDFGKLPHVVAVRNLLEEWTVRLFAECASSSLRRIRRKPCSITIILIRLLISISITMNASIKHVSGQGHQANAKMPQPSTGCQVFRPSQDISPLLLLPLLLRMCIEIMPKVVPIMIPTNTTHTLQQN